MRTCREAVNGQGKRRRHKVAYGLQKVDRLGVNLLQPLLLVAKLLRL